MRQRQSKCPPFSDALVDNACFHPSRRSLASRLVIKVSGAISSISSPKKSKALLPTAGGAGGSMQRSPSERNVSFAMDPENEEAAVKAGPSRQPSPIMKQSSTGGLILRADSTRSDRSMSKQVRIVTVEDFNANTDDEESPSPRNNSAGRFQS